MSKVVISFLKILAIVFSLVAIALVFYGTEYLQLPWWYGALILSATIGVITGFYCLYRLIVKRRNKRFVKNVIAHDAIKLKTSSDQYQERENSLKIKWEEAISTIKTSQLKKHGNPIYALPWFLVIGETDSGKSSAIENSGLSPLLSKAGPAGNISNDTTENCDWWFFEEAIILDTAGRYTVPLEQNNDEREWQEFLTLVTRYRRREPINGVVVCLPADKLVNDSRDKLQAYGRYIASRLNNLSGVLRSSVPIYILVTKADQIYGFQEFSELFDAAESLGVFGFTSSQELPATEFSEHACGHLAEQVMAKLLSSEIDDDSQALVLASEIFEIRKALHIFIKTTFGHQRYYGACWPKGLYLSSARQNGFAKSLTFDDIEKTTLQQTENGLFLHDFFAKFLPSQRYGYRESHETKQWNRNSFRLVLAMLLFTSLAAIAGLTISYLNSEAMIKEINDNINEFNHLPGDDEQQILKLGSLAKSLINIEDKTNSIFIGHLMFSDSVQSALDKAWQEFGTRFMRLKRRSMLVPNTRANLIKNDNYVGYRVDQLSKQLIAIRQVLASNAVDETTLGLVSNSDGVEGNTVSVSKTTINALYDYMFYQYLLHQAQPDNVLKLEKDTLTELNKLLRQHSDLRWLLSWANSQVKAISSNDYWQLPLRHNISIPGGFTSKGKEKIDALISRLEDIQADSLKLKAFYNWYSTAYIDRWYRFNLNFLASGRGMSRAEQQNIILSLAEKDNVFTALQKATITQLKSIESYTSRRPVQSLNLSMNIIDSYWAEAEGNNVNKVKAAIDRAMDSQSVDDSISLQYLNEGIVAYKSLLQGVSKLIGSLATDTLASNNLGQEFDQLQADSIPIALNKLKHVVNIPGGKAFGYIVYNNTYQFLMNASISMASCWVQKKWESDILGPMKYMPPDEANTMLLANNGLLSSFLKKTLAPFATLTPQGWQASIHQGRQLNFESDFFEFVDKAAYVQEFKKTDYQVNIAVLPNVINKGARLAIESTTLSLDCQSGVQQLIDYNYPVNKDFKWSPALCGNTTLTIDFGDFSLKKVWTGQSGFAHFLSASRAGSIDFVRDDFPQHTTELAENNIQSIRLNFNIEQAMPVLNWYKASSIKVPETITICHE